jgi:outer membrane protein TolC
MKPRTILFLLFLLPGFLRLEAQEVKTFTLAEARTYALTYSKDLALKQIEVEQARYKVKESLALLLPQVNADLSYTRFGKIPATIIPANALFPGSEESVVQFGFPSNLDVSINATQTVFNGAFLVGLKAAEIFVNISKQEKEVKSDEVIDLVTRSYYNALVARESADIVAGNIKNLESLYNQTRQLFEAGLVEEIDVDRLELSLSNLKIQVKTLKKNSEVAEIVLKYQMGLPLDEPIILSEKIADFMDEAPMLFSEKGDFGTRKEMRLMDLREAINEANVKRLKFGYLPTITAFAGVGSQAQRQSFNFFRFGDQYPWFNVRNTGFIISIPIWDSFEKKAQIQSARLDIERIKLGRDLMVEGFKLEYEKARTDYFNAMDEYREAEKNMELANKIYRVAQIKYKEGVGSSLELTDAEQQLYTTQANLINAAYKVIMAKADINKSLGNN